MKKLVSIIFCGFVFFVISCKGKIISENKTQNAKYLNGYWIPQQIKWGGDDPIGKDTGDVFRIASFRTLCFENNNKFIYFVSTQRHPRNFKDSIIFAGEPAFNVFAGRWESINDTLLEVDYIPVEYNINPPDTKERHERLKILFQKDTLLLFEGALYRRTYLYDKISEQTIEEYIKQYLK